MLDYPRRPTYHHKPRVTHLGSGLYRRQDGQVATGSGANSRPSACRSEPQARSAATRGGGRRSSSAGSGVDSAGRSDRSGSWAGVPPPRPGSAGQRAGSWWRSARGLENGEEQSREFRRKRREGRGGITRPSEELEHQARARYAQRTLDGNSAARDDRTSVPRRIGPGRPDRWAPRPFAEERKRATSSQRSAVETRVGPARHGRTPKAPPDRENVG